MRKTKQAISLITLVITIVIMIILAGAIILTLTSSGIFDKANDAVSAYDLKQVQTIADLAWAEAYADEKTSKSELQEAVNKALTDNGLDEKFEANVTEKGVTITVKKPLVDGSQYLQFEVYEHWDGTVGAQVSVTEELAKIEGNVIIKIPEKAIIDGTEYDVIYIADMGQNSNVVRIEIPKTVKDYYSYAHKNAFCSCAGLKEIIVADDNETYLSEDGVVYSKDKTGIKIYPCAKEGSFEIPDTVTYLYYDEFTNCTGLTELTIGAGVASVPDGFFGQAGFAQGCKNLVAIYVDSNNEYFSSEGGVMYNKDITAIVKCPPGKSGEFALPATVKEVYVRPMSYSFDPFAECTKITSLTISSEYAPSVEQLTNLKTINVTENNNNYSSVDGVLYDKEKKTLVAYPTAKSGAYVIPASVTSIGDEAFRGCSGLTSVTIPASVISIGYQAFYGCTDLETITIPGSVTSIGRGAFMYSSKLKDIYYGGAEFPYTGTLPEGCTVHLNSTGPDSE